MKHMSDIAVYSRDGRLQLVVEVKSITHSTSSWAAQLMRNLLAHGMLTPAPFIMLVCNDRVYLWKGLATDRSPIGVRRPDYEDDTAQYLRAHLPGVERATSEVALEMAVRSWLEQVMAARPRAEKPDSLLIESGLADAIWNGTIAVEAPV